MRTQLDIQRTVEAIQSALAADGATPISALERIAEDYATACSELNQRLRECHDLLRRGLRSEALQQAEIEPNLLDMAVALDFPERAQWCEWLKHSARAVPPELRIDAAAEINAAYAQQEPLAGLLARHRLAALGRSPLPERIGILRRIAQADPDNPVWQDDLRTYEKGRHKQLQSEAETAARKKDVATLDRLEAELRDSDWLVPPESALVQRTVAAATRLRQANAREELKKLEQELTAAFSAFDVERGRALRGRWQACAAIAELAPDDPIAVLAAPALEWLAAQDQQEQAQAGYSRAVAQLELALDEGAARDDLERRYQDLLRFERGAPELLELRYRQRVGSLDLAASRRNKLWLTGIAAGVLAVAGLSGFWINRQLADAQVAETQTVLKKLIDDSKLNESQKYLDELTGDREWLKQRPEIVELEARLSGLEEKERQRVAAFKMALDGAKAAGLDRPDKKLLDEARSLARGPQEKAETLQWERKVAERQQELQDQRNQAYMKRVEALQQRLRQYEAKKAGAGEDALAAIDRLADDAKALEHESAGVDRALTAGVSALRKKLWTMHDAEQSRLDRQRSLREITRVVGNRRRFREHLAAYAKEYPDTKRTYDFLKVLAKEPANWEQLDQWDALVARFASGDSTQITPKAAAEQTAKAKTLLSVFAAAPEAARVKQHVDFLEPIARRVAGGVRIDAALKDLFQLPTVANLTMVEDNLGMKFYTNEKPKPQNKVVTFNYLSDLKLKTRPTLVKEADLARDGIAPAPQSVAAELVLDELAKLDDAHWEAAFCRMLLDVEGQARMDPVLKVQLLQQVLKVARQGSLVLEHGFAKTAELLDGAKLDGTINWLDPTDANAEKARRQAEEVLKRLPDLHVARDAAAQEFVRLRQPWPTEPHRWVGWLRQAEDGRWRISTEPLPDDITGELLVVSPAEEGPAVKFEHLGSIKAGQPELVEADDAFVEGRPVYAVAPTPEGN